MAYEQKDNSGVLFRNERKEQDNHPDYTGKAMIEGVEYWVSAWVKQTREGKKYFSIAYKPKQEGGEGAGGRFRQAQARSAPGAERRGSPSSGRWDDSETLPF